MRTSMSKLKRIPTYNEYYSRQIILKELGRKGQQKLTNSEIAIIGLGGLGTVSSLYLALAGVGHLRLIDQDVVEPENLHRQVLYGPGDLFYPKVEAAAQRLKATNPLINVEPIAENLNAKNVEKLLSGVDCVVDGLDNMHTRYLINRACIKLGIPYVFGAAIGIEGNLSVFSPPATPCLECVFPNVNDDSLPSCDSRGVLGVTAGIIGTMQAMETIKTLTGIGSTLKSKLLICDFSDMYFSTIDINKRKNCSACKASKRLPKEKLVWLCGRNTVNVNPTKTIALDLNRLYDTIKHQYKIHVKSRLAIMLSYKNFEVTLFNNGRMLIKNAKDEKHALTVYREIFEKLRISK